MTDILTFDGLSIAKNKELRAIAPSEYIDAVSQLSAVEPSQRRKTGEVAEEMGLSSALLSLRKKNGLKALTKAIDRASIAQGEIKLPL